MATPDDTITKLAQTLPEKVGVLAHPDDVLSHANLTLTEKREVLGAWASDAHGVVDAPGIRRLDSGAAIRVDEVLSALRALDELGAGRGSTVPIRVVERRRPSLSRVLVTLTCRDDDDDPPPSPAAALPPGLEAARRRKWEPCGNP